MNRGAVAVPVNTPNIRPPEWAWKQPSGVFKPTRKWACPHHDWPEEHYCDCPDCDKEWDCELCETSFWVSGPPHELTRWEAWAELDPQSAWAEWKRSRIQKEREAGWNIK